MWTTQLLHGLGPATACPVILALAVARPTACRGLHSAVAAAERPKGGWGGRAAAGCPRDVARACGGRYQDTRLRGQGAEAWASGRGGGDRGCSKERIPFKSLAPVLGQGHPSSSSNPKPSQGDGTTNGRMRWCIGGCTIFITLCATPYLQPTSPDHVTLPDLHPATPDTLSDLHLTTHDTMHDLIPTTDDTLPHLTPSA